MKTCLCEVKQFPTGVRRHTTLFESLSCCTYRWSFKIGKARGSASRIKDYTNCRPSLPLAAQKIEEGISGNLFPSIPSSIFVAQQPYGLQYLKNFCGDLESALLIDIFESHLSSAARKLELVSLTGRTYLQKTV